MKWIDEGSVYAVQLPNSKIEIRYTTPRLEADSITLAFRNSSGVEVGVLSALKPEPDAEEIAPDWPLLETLYAEAHRSVAGWETVVNEIESALSGTESIGIGP